MEADGAGLRGVQLQESVHHRLPLLMRQGPGHDRHAGAPELGGVLEAPQGIHHGAVHLAAVGGHLGAILDPGVLQGLVSAHALRGIHHQELPHEVFGALRDRAPLLVVHVVHARHDANDLMILRTCKGHAAGEQNVHNHSKTPQVTLRTVGLVQHLRGDVAQSAAACFHLGIGLPDLAEAEVDELQMVRVLPSVHEVLQLDVPVHDPSRMNVFQCPQQLLGQNLGLQLRFAAAGQEIVPQAAALLSQQTPAHSGARLYAAK
mmetsp:Transcript_122501/g.291174  ORF Transcript_122501/g.291174 Transcript_122501/m.291174 type:complete len:261 (-) Transcript_122501:926-1708(-)